MASTDTTIGPIQMIAVAFSPDAKFEGKILEEFENLEKSKILRVLDLLFVKKTDDGKELVALELQGKELGAIVGALLGFEFDGSNGERKKSVERLTGNAFGLNPMDIEKIGFALSPGMSAGIVLIEHLWARNLKHAIRSNGGIPIAEGFLTPESVSRVSEELEGLTEAMNEMEKEEGRPRVYL